MFNDEVPTDQARVLAELIDTALAEDWTDGEVMALLWQASDDPDDLRLAFKRLERSIDEELAPLDDGSSYLAVAHSTVTHHAPGELLCTSDEAPVRITVAVDYEGQSGVLRHRNGSTQWFGGAVDLPIAKLVRSLLWFEPAA